MRDRADDEFVPRRRSDSDARVARRAERLDEVKRDLRIEIAALQKKAAEWHELEYATKADVLSEVLHRLP